MSDLSEASEALTCNEVWGGNRKIVRTLQMPSVTAWVASLPLNENEGGGDLYYMSVCAHDLISRVALADVSGHGGAVSATTENLHRLMRQYIDVWDQADFMRELTTRLYSVARISMPLRSCSAFIASRVRWRSVMLGTCPHFGITLARRHGDGLQKRKILCSKKVRVCLSD